MSELKSRTASVTEFAFKCRETYNIGLTTAYRGIKLFKLHQLFPSIVLTSCTVTEVDAFARDLFYAAADLQKLLPVHPGIHLLARPCPNITIKGVPRTAVFVEAAAQKLDAEGQELFKDENASWNKDFVGSASLLESALEKRVHLLSNECDLIYQGIVSLESTDEALLKARAQCVEGFDRLKDLQETLLTATKTSDKFNAASTKLDALRLVSLQAYGYFSQQFESPTEGYMAKVMALTADSVKKGLEELEADGGAMDVEADDDAIYEDIDALLPNGDAAALASQFKKARLGGGK